jgi:ABC-type multidrug transport system ATPase subunit
MSLLQMRDAEFVRRGTRAGPFSVELQSGERCAATFATPREASIVAMMAAGIVKATRGHVFVDHFDPRIQPVHVKSVVGFVPHEAVQHEFETFAQYVDYRAALWNVPGETATARAYHLLERLEGVHEAFAYPLVGALLARPRMLVLDRPQGAYAAVILDVAGAETTIFSTHNSAREARMFGEACALESS